MPPPLPLYCSFAIHPTPRTIPRSTTVWLFLTSLSHVDTYGLHPRAADVYMYHLLARH